jgi:predicted regulator of Ras-like GTPase activity (Roadblock/LC7/MglB family)
MEDLDSVLGFLVDNVDGALSAAIGGMDGLLIAQYPVQGQDLTVIAAEKTRVLAQLRQAYNGALAGGKLGELIVVADRLIGYTRLLTDDLFCLIVMNPSGNIGKARLYSDRAAARILEVLV